MSASQYRSQLNRKRSHRVDAEKKAGEQRSKESSKRADAAKARAAAAKAKTATTAASKTRSVERLEREAAAAGKAAAGWQTKATSYGKEEAKLQEKLASAETAEAAAAERNRQRGQQRSDRNLAAESAALSERVTRTEGEMAQLREQREPKAEKLRVLLLGASSRGGLRVGREQKRIRLAVESALHRDLVELDVRPAATAQDLLDGITKFRPHVVHFSGHSNEGLIEFEKEKDERHEGVIVSAQAFARAVEATDDPPLLVLLNSCHSASQIDGLVEKVAPFAIGMSDSIGDNDAINYAAQFYAAVANGQSIRSAHLSAQAALELAGLEGADLPTLAWAQDTDPAAAILVRPAE